MVAQARELEAELERVAALERELKRKLENELSREGGPDDLPYVI